MSGMSRRGAIDLAITYGNQGIPTIPIKIYWDKDEGKLIKKPFFNDWLTKTSTKTDDIVYQFRCAHIKDGQEWGVGLVLGPANKLVVDLDRKNGVDGFASIKELERINSTLPRCRVAATPSGGWHWWFSKPQGVGAIGNSKPAAGIDIRCDHGYVVAPGTRSTWGNWLFEPDTLDVEEDPDLPLWICELIQQHQTKSWNGSVPDYEPLPAILSSDVTYHRYIEPEPGKRHVQVFQACKDYLREGMTHGQILTELHDNTKPIWSKVNEEGSSFEQFAMERIVAAEESLSKDSTNGNHPFDEGKTDATVTNDPNSWQVVDLGPALRGERVRQDPTILTRSDGRSIFYKGQVNYMHGVDGIGKSFAALFAVIQEILAGHHVLWIDCEDPDETTIVGRLKDFGLTDAVIHKYFHYISPDEEATPEIVSAVCVYIQKLSITLAVIDSVGEAFSIEGINEDKDGEVAPWMRKVPRKLADAGAGVIPIDHATNANDNPLRPSGSKRKRASITGHGVVVQAETPLSKENGGGVLKLICAKDRHGNYTRGKEIATIHVTNFDSDTYTFQVLPPSDATKHADNNQLSEHAKIVRQVVHDYWLETSKPIPSINTLKARMREDGHRVRDDDIRSALEYALDKGLVHERAGSNKARLLYPLDPDNEQLMEAEQVGPGESG